MKQNLANKLIDCEFMNNFIHRKTVEVQYKQRAIHEKKASIAKQQVTYNSCNLAKHYTL